MYLYLSLLIEAGFVAAIILFLWIILIKARNKRILNIRDASLTCEELEDHARKLAIEHFVSRKQDLLNWPIPRMNDNYSFILSVYKDLNEDIQKKRAIPSAAEWLLDNFYIIEEQVKSIRRDLVKKDYLRLPVLKCGSLKGNARIFAVAMDLVAHTDEQIDENILLNYLNAYQSHSVLFDREIWAVPIMIRIAIIENIRNICEKIKDSQLQWRKADEMVDSWLANDGVDTDKIMRLFNN